jgi:hypothetical protein
VIQCFYNAKSVFLAINASLRWLNNVSGVYLVKVSLLLIASGAWDIPPIPTLASHWLDDCANFMPTQEENDQYSANHF